MTPDEAVAIKNDFINLVKKHIDEICTTTNNSAFKYIFHGYPRTLSFNMFEFLKQFSFCVEFIRKMKQEQKNKIPIPYCMNVFNIFIKSNIVKKYYSRWLTMPTPELHLLCMRHEYINNPFKKYHVTVVGYEMFHDDEFAWACFYDLDVFQQFQPFVDYKEYYLLRKERLLAVHEETYEHFDSNNAVNCVFANDFLVKTIMRFL